jgi:hypothetical protein
MSDYVFELASSATMAKLGELTRAKNRSLTLSLNRAGAFQMTLPLHEDLDGNAISMSELIEEGSTCVIIRRNQSIVWSGPVWTVQETTPDSLSVGCVGWLQVLEKRCSKFAWGNPLSYPAQDAGAIALDLLTRSNADNITGPNYVTPGTAETTQSRTIKYQPFSNILNEIIALSDLEAGYDMEVDPTTRKLNFYSTISTGTPVTFFQYGGNARQVSRTSDMSKVSNRIIVYSSVGWIQVDDPISQAQFGVLEEAISLSDVKDTTILQAYANAELAVRSNPLRFSSFEPRSGPSAPRIFQDFAVGSYGFVAVDRGRLKVDKQLVRIFSASVSWPDDGTGTEQVTSIQTTAG